MDSVKTTYANGQSGRGIYQVSFMVNESGIILTRGFSSPYPARKFVNRLKHSRKCTLLSQPIFD